MAVASEFAFHATRCKLCTSQTLCPKGTVLYERARAVSVAMADSIWHMLGDIAATEKRKK